MLSSRQLRELRKTPPAPNRIKAAMRLERLTQEQLADAIGIDQSQISRLARGLYTGPSLAMVRLFTEFFGCSVEDLFPSREEVTR